MHVTVNALPQQVFAGRIAKIAPLPDAQSAWLNPDLKVYPTQIHLEGSHPELRTGMNCQAEIIVEQHADALYVPVQAVVRIGAEPTVYLRDRDGFEPQPIEIGLDNNSMVHVLAGLQPGQEVLLTPPLDAEAEAEEPEPAVARMEHPGGSSSPATQPTPHEAAPPTAERRPERGGDRGGAMFGDMTPEQREEMRKRFQNMSAEEREAMMRQRMENMTPEQREEFERRRRERRSRGDNERRGGSE